MAVGMAQYTHVIFDFGGVITASPFEAFNRLEAERGLPRDFVRGVNARNPDTNAWALFERAEIDAATFDTLFAEEARALGHDLEGEAVLAVLAGAVRPQMVAALDTLKAGGFTIGCITNNVPSGKGAGMARSEAMAAEVAAIMARFDHVIESSKVGVRKPDPRIYQMMCAALGVEPGDDIAEARAVQPRDAAKLALAIGAAAGGDDKRGLLRHRHASSSFAAA